MEECDPRSLKIRKSTMKQINISNKDGVWVYNAHAEQAPLAPQQPEATNIEVFDFHFPLRSLIEALINFLLEITQVNFIIFTWMSY